MGKLYYITGSNEWIREQVYGVILQWSQTQQLQPLQPWTDVVATNTVATNTAATNTVATNTAAPNTAATNTAVTNPAEPGQTQPATNEPNFYLYHYLEKGNIQTLAQLTETYGEDVVEAIYLRSPEETDEGLLEQGIYKSYDPQPDLSQCLQEIVETVFTGYKSVQYDFAAALAQQQQWQHQQQQQQVQQQQTAPHDPKVREGQAQGGQGTEASKQSPNKLPPKKILQWSLILVAWVVVVCIATVWIYSAVTGGGIRKRKGALIQVPSATTPDAVQSTLNDQAEDIPWISLEYATDQATDISVGEVIFAEPKANYSLDVIPGLYRNGEKYCCISYGSDSGEPYYIPCKAAPICQTAKNNQVAAMWIDGTLWLADEKGITPIHENVSYFALAHRAGRYLFFFVQDKLYSYDRIVQETMELHSVPTQALSGSITLRPEATSLAVNWDGTHCAYTYGRGSVVLVDCVNGGATMFEEMGLDTLVAVSDQGKLVYGNASETTEAGHDMLDGEKRLARLSTSDETVTLLGEEDAPCYFNDNGMEVLYEENDALYFYNEYGVREKLTDLNGDDWEPLVSTADGGLYGEHYFVSGASGGWSFGLVAIGGTVYEVVYHNPEHTSLEPYLPSEEIVWQNQAQRLSWLGEDLYYRNGTEENPVFLSGISKDETERVWGYSQHNELFYTNKYNQLYCYSASGDNTYVMESGTIRSRTFADNGDLYYVKQNGVLGYIPNTWEEHREVKALYDFSQVVAGDIFFATDLGNSAVYLSVETRDALDFYRISPTECIYLGGYTDISPELAVSMRNP